MFERTNRDFEGLLTVNEDGLFVPAELRPLTRMIARTFDGYEMAQAGHSTAI